MANARADCSPAKLSALGGRFQIPGQCLEAQPYGEGHINDTFVLHFDQSGRPVRYILQRLNAEVFQDPLAVMANIVAVTRHLAMKLEARGLSETSRRVLTLVPTREELPYLVDEAGDVWRVYVFVEAATSHGFITGPGQAFQVARAVGRFQADLADYQGPRLVETIPHFHDTRRRFEAFRTALEADPLNRAITIKAEIARALAHESLAAALLTLSEQGLLPERITHNDTKLNNVLLDDQSGEGICLLDLDTVMPGLGLCDFGDLVRSACNPVAEGERDLTRVQTLVPVFHALAKGYLEGHQGELRPLERAHLLTAGKVITYECGLRFLTDFLLGDSYFRIHRPGQNLDRGRTQFALLHSLETLEESLQRFVESL